MRWVGVGVRREDGGRLEGLVESGFIDQVGGAAEVQTEQASVTTPMPACRGDGLEAEVISLVCNLMVSQFKAAPAARQG